MDATFQTSILASLVAIVLTLLAGCGGAPDTGRFEISDVRDHKAKRCLNRAFPLEPSFFAARRRIDSIGLFMQSRTGVDQDADLVYIEVFEPGEVRRNTGREISFGFPATADTPALAEVDVRETCRNLNVSLAIQGNLTFSQLGLESGERVEGRLTSGSIVDARTGETVAGSITGRWDFAVRVTSPYRSYPTYREGYPTGPGRRPD